MLAVRFNQADEAARLIDGARASLPAAQLPVEFIDTLTFVYRKAGRPADAREVIEQAVQTHPETSLLHFHLGVVLADLKQAEAAQRLARSFAVGIDRGAREAGPTAAGTDDRRSRFLITPNRFSRGDAMTATMEREGTVLSAERTLAPQLSARWALGTGHLALVVLLGGLFLTVNYLPLRGTDLWLHVNLGQWIWQHGTLPAEDPFMPLARGMPFVDTAWLSQVIFGAVDSCCGHEALSHLFALTVLLTYVVLACAFYLQTGSTWCSVIGIALVLFVGWSRLATIRPENFAALCFAVLLWLIVRRPGEPDSVPRQHLFWSIPLVMLAWANLHGSFVCGLALLGCVFGGRVVEAAWRSRRLRGVLTDGQVLGWLAICQLAVIATLINPYGVDLLLESFIFLRHENLQDVLEWKPLAILAVGGANSPWRASSCWSFSGTAPGGFPPSTS